jgi:TonB-dependent starch-binding outer membrane protein SusC
MKKLLLKLKRFASESNEGIGWMKSSVVLPGLILVLGLLTSGTFAQSQLTGTVSDSKTNNPVAGANVTVEGTTLGTITDLKGSFTLNITDPNCTVAVSFMGYKSQRIPLAGKTFLSVLLEEDVINISELVVIGYGTTKKSDLTGSVAVVTSEDMNRTPASNISSAIQGKASGVVVTQSGEPGGEVRILVRGIGSIHRQPKPLIVIDGIIGADINAISPNDIESFQVLKDASASAIYGVNGSDGVIIITTRRGKQGPAKVTFSTYSSINTIAKQFELMNADEYAALYTKIAENDNVLPDFAYSDKFRQYYYGKNWNTGTDWQNEIVQKSYAQNYYLNVAGGSETSNYSVSAGYYKEKGLLIGSAAERFNMRANSDFKIGKYITVGESINLNRFVKSNATSHEGDPWQLSLIASPLMKIYNEDNKGGYEGPQITYEYSDADTTIDGGVKNTGGNDKGNPLGPLELGDSKTYSHSLSTSFYMEIKPFKWLSLKSTPSFGYSNGRDNNWMPAFDMGVRSLKQASLYSRYSDGYSVSWENQLSIVKSFGKHNITFTAVNHVRKGGYNNLSVDAKGYNYESLNVISGSDPLQRTGEGSEGLWAMNSYLARLMYDYNNLVLLTTSIRRDGTTNFLPDKRWGNFPSFSVALKLKDILLSGVDQVSSAKIRFGWGSTGNSDIGAYQYSSLIAQQSEFSPVFGNLQYIAPALNELNSIGNPKIKWESANMKNFGLDLSLFNNSLEFSGEYYIKNNYDLLIRTPVSITVGRIGSPWDNIAQIYNKGFDVDVRYKKVMGDFSYNLSANLTTINNKVTKVDRSIFSGDITAMKDHAIGSYYGYVCEGIIQEGDTLANGKYKYATQGGSAPGDLRFADLNRDGTISTLDRTIIGKSIPDFTYSLNIDLNYKNFDFSLFLYGMQNYQVYNGLRRDIESFAKQDIAHNKSRDFGLNYWTPENQSTKYIRLDQDNSNDNTRFSSWWLEDASFLRVKDLQVGYTLPQASLDKMKMDNLRVYVSAVNLHTFTKYTGRDPEAPLKTNDPIGSGIDNGTYPLPRVFNIGLQMGF